MGMAQHWTTHQLPDENHPQLTSWEKRYQGTCEHWLLHGPGGGSQPAGMWLLGSTPKSP